MDNPSGGIAPAKEPLEDTAPAEKDASATPAAAPEKHRDHISISDSTATSGGPKEKQPSTQQDAADKDAAFAHLPEEERQILKTQLDSPPVKVNFFGLYRYADAWDWLIVFISAICAIAGGAALPLFTVSLDIPDKIFHR